MLVGCSLKGDRCHRHSFLGEGNMGEPASCCVNHVGSAPEVVANLVGHGILKEPDQPGGHGGCADLPSDWSPQWLTSAQLPFLNEPAERHRRSNHLGNEQE